MTMSLKLKLFREHDILWGSKLDRTHPHPKKKKKKKKEKKRKKNRSRITTKVPERFFVV